MFLFFFFFSSRRRHTRFDCDWSSDVCSSDLCAKTAICRRPDKYHPAVGDYRAAKVGRASCRLQPVYNSNRHLPGDLSLVHVHGVECSPRGLLAWPLLLVPEAGILPFFRSSPVSHWCVSGLRFHCSNGTHLIRVNKQVAGSTVKGSAGPVRSTQ